MKARNNQSGFSAVEVVVVFIVIAVIGLLGYAYYNNQAKKTVSDESSQTSSQATASDVKSAPAINSVADLDAAQATLDQTDPSGSSDADTTQLDAELANF